MSFGGVFLHFHAYLIPLVTLWKTGFLHLSIIDIWSQIFCCGAGAVLCIEQHPLHHHLPPFQLCDHCYKDQQQERKSTWAKRSLGRIHASVGCAFVDLGLVIKDLTT